MIGRREKVRFKKGFKSIGRLSDERIYRGREFQLLGEDMQKFENQKKKFYHGEEQQKR